MLILIARCLLLCLGILAAHALERSPALDKHLHLRRGAHSQPEAPAATEEAAEKPAAQKLPEKYPYQGCFVNEGAGRLEGHTQQINMDECALQSVTRGKPYFGMEYPRDSIQAGDAFCLSLGSLPALSKAAYSECEDDVHNGHALGGSYRLAVYSSEPSQVPGQVGAEDLMNEDAPKKVQSRIEHVLEEVYRMPSEVEKIVNSEYEVVDVLLPGLKIDRESSQITLPIVVIVGLLWLWIYFNFLYSPDHEEYLLEGWDSQEMAETLAAAEGRTNAPHCHADMVFVFHHPDYAHATHDSQISVAALEGILMLDKQRTQEQQESIAERFKNFNGFLHHCGSPHTHSEPERGLSKGSASSMAGDMRKSICSLGRQLSRRLSGQLIDTTMREARVTLMQDFFKCLPEEMGLDLHIFCSVDSDELLVCVSLRQPHMIQFYLSHAGIELQTTYEVVQRLGIEQDPHDTRSSPPHIPFDTRLVGSMSEAKVIDEPSERLLYRTYHDRDPNGSVMSSKERITVIMRELTECLDLDVATRSEVLVDWYPVHSDLWISKLKEEWLKKGFNWRFKQPVALLQDYFGTQIAFNFAWQGLICKCLFALSVVALAVEMVKAAPKLGMDTIIYEKQILPFAVIVIIWLRIVANLWEREETYFTHLWKMGADKTDRLPRPSFRGQLVTSDIDSKIQEENLPRTERIRLRALSMMVTFFCCFFVFLIISAWVIMHEGQMDIVATIFLSLFVKVSEFSYNMLSAKLADWENHKYDDEFHDCWVWQQFMFQALNAYWACIAIALTQLWTGNCPEDGCFPSLRHQLTMMMVILMLCSVSFIFLEVVMVRIKIIMEDRALEASTNKEVATERSYLEEQAKYGVYGIKEQIENMMQLVLGLGFVILFAVIQPLVVPLCLLHIGTTCYARALLLVSHTKRCVPYSLVGVGAWKSIMHILMNLAVFSSGFFLVYWGRFFKGGTLIAKLTGMILWTIFCHSAWAIVNVVCPPGSSDTSIMTSRRKYVERIINETAMDVRSMKVEEAREATGSARGLPTEAARSKVKEAPEEEEEAPVIIQTITDIHTHRKVHVSHIQQKPTADEIFQKKCAQLVQEKRFDEITTLAGRAQKHDESD